MTSLKEYNSKIHSLKNIAKMTKTMKLVSASKLRKIHRAQANAKLYERELTALIARLAASVEEGTHPLLVTRENAKQTLLLVITSAKGLCGGFNNILNKRVTRWIEERKPLYSKIDLSFCGKRGYMFFRKYSAIKKYYEGVSAKPDFIHAERIGNELQESFLKGEYDEIYLVYNRFHSPISQTPIFEKILPIDARALVEGGKPLASHYLFEPEKLKLLQFLIPRFFYFKIYCALLENSAGEHAARMTAMDQATQNALELIDRYTLFRNRARQAAITTELIEIVTGAESLKSQR